MQLDDYITESNMGYLLAKSGRASEVTGVWKHHFKYPDSFNYFQKLSERRHDIFKHYHEPKWKLR